MICVDFAWMDSCRNTGISILMVRNKKRISFVEFVRSVESFESSIEVMYSAVKSWFWKFLVDFQTILEFYAKSVCRETANTRFSNFNLFVPWLLQNTFDVINQQIAK